MHIITKLRDPAWWREQILTDLFFLCRNILITLEDPTPGFKDLNTKTHKKICEFIEKWTLPGHEILLLCPRAWLKSYIVTCGFMIQRILRNLVAGKREMWLLASAIEPNALELLWRNKYNFMQNEELRFYFKDYIPEDPTTQADRWTQQNIELRGNRIQTGSVDKALESRHFGGGVINDDLVCWANSRTTDQLKKTIEWWRVERPLLMPQSVKINIGTRWDEEDLYGYILTKFLRLTRKQFDKLKRQPSFEFHRSNFHFLYFSCWADPISETGSTFPNLYPQRELKRIIREMGDLAGGQMLNDPLSMAEGRVKRHWIKEWKEYGIPEHGGLPEIRTTLMTLDWAGSDKKHSDYTGMTVVDAGVDKKLYVRLGEREKLSDKALIDKIIKKAFTYYPDLIGIEQGKFESIRNLMELMIPDSIRRGEIPRPHIEYAQRLPYILVELRHHGRPKPVRMEGIIPWIEQARMLFAPHGMEDLIEELLRMPKGSRDDIADALAYILDLLALVGFPNRSDPVKYLVIPEELKMSKEERERLDWEQYEKDVGLYEPTPVDEYEEMEDF